MDGFFQRLMVAAWVVLALPQVVAAQAEGEDAGRAQPLASGGEDERARQLYEEGREAFLVGDYDAALEAYQASFELSRRPELLYNMGTVYDRQRDDAHALEMFERFLEVDPESAVAHEVRARIRVLREAQERGEDAPEEAEPSELEPLAPADTADGSSHEPVDDGGGPEEDDGGGRLWTWVFGGVALATVGGAIAMGVVANDSYAQLENGCGAMGGCSDREIDDSGVETQALVTNILWGAAGAFAVTALVLAFVEGGGGGDEEEAPVAVGVGPGGVHLRGRF